MTISFQNGSFLTGSSSVSSYTQSGGITAASLYNTDYLDSKYDYNDTRESYEVAYSGRDAAIETKISNLCSYIANGQEDKAFVAYEELLNEMKLQARYEQLVDENGDDTQLKSVARKLIETDLGGDLEEFIRENTRTNSRVENQKVLTWGNCDTTTQEDLLAEICDIDEEKGNGSILVQIGAAIASPFVVFGNWLFNGGKKM